LEGWRENGIDTTIPQDTEETKQKLSLCKGMRAFIRDQGETPLDELGSLIDRLQAASQADESLRRAEQMIETAEEESNHSKATYILQSAEQAVQQLVTSRRDLGAVRRERIQEMIRELENVSDTLAKVQRSEQDRRRWESFLEEHEEALEEFESWDPKQSKYWFKDVTGTVSKRDDEGSTLSHAKTKREPGGDTHLTEKITELEDLIQILSRVADEIRSPSGQEVIEDKIGGLSETLEAARLKRQQVYNEFALARIRKSFSEAKEAMGWTYNSKQGIADAMVDYLAEVNQKCLTSEVGRCYSEVFEHLYGKLKKAKSEEDFEEEGRKLNVLKRMHESKTIGAEAF